MEQSFEKMFSEIDENNWEDALRDAERFIAGVKETFDKSVTYLFFEDDVSAGKTYRHLAYTDSWDISDGVKKFLEDLVKKCQYLTMLEVLETDFEDIIDKYSRVTKAIDDEDLTYLKKLSKADLSSVDVSKDLDWCILEQADIMEGIRDYYSSTPLIPVETDDDKLMFYLIFKKDGSNEFLSYTHASNITDELKKFFEVLEEKCPSLKMEWELESDFSDTEGEFGMGAEEILSEQLTQLNELIKTVDLSSLKGDLSRCICNQYDIIDGIKDYLL